tara:strand:- start:827 stop:1768 length:942 start_codon:yes stop_codon:yes gene_type:complete
MKLYDWKEFIQEAKDVDLESFELKDSLHPKFWDGNKLVPEIRQKLIQIATKFFDDLGLEGVDIDDITFTGSLANYNWSNYSDIDLHIKVDFAKVDENLKLVESFFRSKSANWNNKHKITIFDFEVELYVEKTGETHISTGIYSIKNDKWLTMPSKTEYKIDAETVSNKAVALIDRIDTALDLFEDKKYDEAHNMASGLRDKIKKLRRSGLNTGGQFSTENLVFKVLRRNGYLGKLFDLIRDSYDKMMSMSGNYEKKFKSFIDEDQIPKEKGFDRLKEEEKYQNKVKRGYMENKEELIGIRERSKSSPPGFQGV